MVYDGMKRLISVRVIQRAYDELSNLVARANGVAYAYQDYTESRSGSDASRILPTTARVSTIISMMQTATLSASPKGAGWRYNSLAFDNLNHLRQIVYSQADNYWYNASGRRIRKPKNRP